MILPSSVKMLRLSSEAFSKSFEIKPEEARRMLSCAFNAGSWNNLCSKIETSSKKEYSVQEIEQVHQIMTAKIGDYLDIELSNYLYKVVASCSPFSKKPKVLSFSLPTYRDKNSNDGSINLSELLSIIDPEETFESFMDSIDTGEDSEFSDFIKDMKNIGFEEFQNKMRLSKPIEPYWYLVAIDNLLKWDTSDKALDFEHGEPVFYWIDHNGNENPVLINGVSITPGDSDDINTYDSLLTIASDGYDLFDKPIILFGTAVHKKINGSYFCVIGVWNNGEDWHWLFLSELTPTEQVVIYPDSKVNRLENTLMDPPPPSQLACITHESGLPSFYVYHCITHPTSDPEANGKGQGLKFDMTNRPSVTGFSGWEALI